MQSRGLSHRANPRHPDFKGCVAAWPMVNPLSQPNAVSRLYPMTSTAATRKVMRHGVGYEQLSTLGYSTAATIPAWSSGFSWLIQFNQDQTGGFPREIFEVNGHIFMTEIARQVSLYTTAGTQKAASTTVITLGREYSLGIRFDNASGVVSFFIDGVREDVTSVSLTPSATALTVGGGSFRNGGSGRIRDIRLYNRPMPDSTFERYHYNPNGFYLNPQRNWWKAVSFNAGRFMPFMHPALQS